MYQFLKLRKNLSPAKPRESIYVLFTWPSHSWPAQLILVQLSPQLQLCPQHDDPVNSVYSKGVLHLLLKDCNTNCSMTKQKAGKLKLCTAQCSQTEFLPVCPFLGALPSPGGRFTIQPLTSFPIGLPQFLPSSSTALSCPTLVLADLLQPPNKKSLFLRFPDKFRQRNRLFTGALQQFKLWLLLSMEARGQELASRKGHKSKIRLWWPSEGCVLCAADTRILPLLWPRSFVPKELYFLLGALQYQNRHCDNCWKRIFLKLQN